MKITFLMPCYMWVPSGGFRIVYEYANQLVARGHEVYVVHPRRLKHLPVRRNISARELAKAARWGLKELLSKPTIYWHDIDERVNIRFVPNSDPSYLPNADVLFATAWSTVASVLDCPRTKGEKCYLIQHYETWLGPKHLVDDTWRAPLHKIVISRWLLEIGDSLGASGLTYIPNAINFDWYRLIRPIEGRPRQVVMVCSGVEFKRGMDGIRAIEIAKNEFPDLNVVLFGNGRRPSWIPGWMSYFRDPAQRRIIEDFYNNSSIVLSSSLTEGFALPPAEGAACGCAIIATDSGGIRDFVESGVTGLLSAPQDPRALAENLCALLRNDDLRIRLAYAANRRIARFTWEKSAALMEDFLARVSHRGPVPERFRSSDLVAAAPADSFGTQGVTSATRES
jgi:L-malate glycosyltransferase